MDYLVYKAKRGDKNAFSELLRRNTPSMYKVAKAILKNDDDAADAIQETALTCWEKIHTLQKDRYFKTWLIRILINNCNVIYREKSHIFSDDAIPEAGSLEESYANVEWREFLSHLDEKHRVVAVLFYIEGFKIREIADILQISQNTVSTRLAAAREKMRKLYSQEPPKAGSTALKRKELSK